MSEKTLTRDQAVARLQALGPATCSYWADIDHPREMLASHARLKSGPPAFYEGAEIVRAYVRHLDAAEQAKATDHYREGLYRILRGEARPRSIAADYLGEPVWCHEGADAPPSDEMPEDEAYGWANQALRRLYEANVEIHVIQQVTDTVMCAVREAWAHRRAGSGVPAAPPKPPPLSWAHAVDIVKMLAPCGDVARRAAAVIRIAEGREAAPDAEATTGRDGDEDARDEAAAGLLHTMDLHPHYPLRHRSNWAACLSALAVLAPEAARRLRAGEAPGYVERALFPSSDNEPASDGCPDGCGAPMAAPIDGGAPRPKVGAWQQPKEYDGAEWLYDNRGQLVGAYDPRNIPGYDWFAVRPLLLPATGTAATPSLARRAILEVLKTWADVSAVETE